MSRGSASAFSWSLLSFTPSQPWVVGRLETWTSGQNKINEFLNFLNLKIKDLSSNVLAGCYLTRRQRPFNPERTRDLIILH